MVHDDLGGIRDWPAVICGEDDAGLASAVERVPALGDFGGPGSFSDRQRARGGDRDTVFAREDVCAPGDEAGMGRRGGGLTGGEEAEGHVEGFRDGRFE